MKSPLLCRPEAYRFFAQSIPRLDTGDGLLRAAVAIAMHALDDVDPAAIDAELTALANRVRARAPHGGREARIAHLHEVLFEEEGFAGDSTRYYHPLNSYLPAVLRTKRGIPISLALIYKIVGERVGLRVEGVNAPAHFLVRVQDSCGWLLVDPFHRGRILSADEATGQIRLILGGKVDVGTDVLRTATHSQWLERMLLNLRHSLSAQHCTSDFGAMTELQTLLTGEFNA